MEKPLDRRARYTLRAIRGALYELMEEQPLEKIPVTRLCRLADVNRGTFYHYYRDVFDLYEKLEDDFLCAVRAILSAPEEDMSALLALMEENRALLRPGRNAERIREGVLPALTDRLHARRPDAAGQDLRLMGEYMLGGCARLCEMWLAGDLDRMHLLSALQAFAESTLCLHKN